MMKKIIQHSFVLLLLFAFQNANAQPQLTTLENQAEVAIKKEADLKKVYKKSEKKYKKIDRQLKKLKKAEKQYTKEYDKASTAAKSLRTEGLEKGNADKLKEADGVKSYAKKMDKQLKKVKKRLKKRKKQYGKIESEYTRTMRNWENALKGKEKAMKAMKAAQSE